MDFLLITFAGAIVALVVGVVLLQRSTKAQREREHQTTKQKMELYRKFAEDFSEVGWPAWGYAIHIIPEQRSRIEKGIYSKRMKLLGYDTELHTACVLGEHGEIYNIDSSGCSCPDFKKRGLPCKHMYFAVIEISEKA